MRKLIDCFWHDARCCCCWLAFVVLQVVVDADPAGLQEAAANASGDEWQPERTAGRGSRPQRQSARRSGLSRAAAAGSDAAGGSDSEEPVPIPAAAAALRGWLETDPGNLSSSTLAQAAQTCQHSW